MTLKTKKTVSLFIFCILTTIATAQTVCYATLFQKLQALQLSLVPDKRVAILEIEIRDTLQSPITIVGETDLYDAKAQVLDLLKRENVSFIDSIKVLPYNLPDNKTWALGTLSVSNVRSKPSHSSELVSQVMMGTPMKVLDIKDNWYRIQTPEKYIGWMDAGSLISFNEADLNNWKKSNRYIFNDINGTAFSKPNRRSEVVTDLTLCNIFNVEKSTLRYFKIKLPDNRSGYIRKKSCLSFNRWSEQPINVNTILKKSHQLMGSPYLWGGASCKAIDCSGFVKLGYLSQGVVLARDASQQAKYGEPIDYTTINNLQPGDLLFFGSSVQKITHVGLYISEGNFIHASGRVHISSIIPSDEKYVPSRNLVAARRVINSIDTEGIISIKKHPWYTLQTK